MKPSDSRHWNPKTRDRSQADRPDVLVPILRSGVLARRFCEVVALANVEAVFERCLYLRSGDEFICIGEPDIGNGPITLVGNLGVLPTVKSLTGQVALICGRCITIGNSARFTLDQSKVWRPVGWPKCPPPDHLTRICADLAARAAIGAPHEGLARCVAGGSETFAPAPWLARAANPRLTLFERCVSGLLERHGPAAGCRDAIQGLIGLGPGLTPSGDDFLVGALSVLDAIGEREAHAAMARAIVDALPGRTTPLSACFLRAAAVGHIGENLHQAVSQLLTGDADTAIAAVAKIGHSSGWDMIAGILTTLMIATARRQVRASHVFACS